jgi:hypothetical protein
MGVGTTAIEGWWEMHFDPFGQVARSYIELEVLFQLLELFLMRSSLLTILSGEPGMIISSQGESQGQVSLH